MNTKAIEITPEVTVLSVLRHLNYKAWYAIAEFVDNSIQSSILNQSELSSINGGKFKLCIKISLDSANPGKITISDNAAGIRGIDFPRAFKAAQVPPDRTGLSEFGMGMKSAACWFSQNWSVRTKHYSEKVERTISFDVKKIVEQKIGKLDVQSRKINGDRHYTVVTLHNLHQLPQGRTVSKIKDHLSSMYRFFIRDDLVDIYFNNEILTYKSPDVLMAPKYVSPGNVSSTDKKVVEWKKKIEFSLDENVNVKGVVALRAVGSTHSAGLALFRRNRLILGSSDETYRPDKIFKRANSYVYQRLFGDLHMEGFEVSHTKDGFRWEKYEDKFLDILKKEIESEPLNLIAQAENYRSIPNKKSIGDQAVRATIFVAKHIKDELEPRLIDTKKDSRTLNGLKGSVSDKGLRISEKTVKINDGQYEWTIILSTTVDPAVEEWIELSKVENSSKLKSRKLWIQLSLAHPFSTKFLGTDNENVELLLRMASGICISLVLTEDLTGNPSGGFLYHFNKLLRDTILDNKE